MRFILPLITDNRQVLMLSRGNDMMVEFGGKGMSSVYDQGNGILPAKDGHFFVVHPTRHSYSMHQLNTLPATSGRIPERLAGLFKNLYCSSSFSSASEYQYHIFILFLS